MNSLKPDQSSRFQPHKHPYIDGKPKKLLIGGQWREAVSGKTFTSINPSTGLPIIEIADAGAEDIDLAVAAARKAFDTTWRKYKPLDRQAILNTAADIFEKRYEEFAWLDSIDYGGPISRTRSGKRRHVGLLRYYAAQAVSLHGETIENSLPGDYFTYTLKEPVGVVGAITPWNGPVGNSLWKIGPALAAGCAVVLKPSEQASLSTLMLGQLFLDAGLPPGVLNIVTGAGATGAALAAHPGVDKVAFTGSTATGQAIVRASAGNLKRLSLELGGKSPNIVFADADLDEAVPGAAMAVFANSGQICSAGTRLFVERKIYEEFVERIAAYGRSIKVGDVFDPETAIGPLVSESQLKRVCGYLEVGRSEGARVLAGGERLNDGDLASGYFVPPTVFGDVHDDMIIAREEIFGPVISALPFDNIEEVIARGNDTSFGLGAGVWTKDLSRAHRLSRELQSGSVWVNCYQAMDPAVPFGGYKMSGYGRESGIQHVEEYLNVKAVTIKVS